MRPSRPIHSPHKRACDDRRHAQRACALLCIVWLWLASGSAFALDPRTPFAHYRFDHWGSDEGLPQITVATLAQGRLGYLWVGTQNGIARFDGDRFTVYDREHGGVDTTLPTSSLATADGRIWFGTPRGALWIADGRVHAVPNGGRLVGVLDLAQDPAGHVLAAGDNGLYRIDGERLLVDPRVSGPAYALTSDGPTLWVGGRGVITRVDGARVERIALADSTLQVRRIVREGERLWLGTPQGLQTLDLTTHTLARVPQADDGSIESLLLDGNGNLWVGSVEHLRRRFPDGRWETIGDDDLFAHPWIDAIFEDREGGLWLGSRTQSLVRLRDSAVSRIGAREGLSDAFVWSLARGSDGALLLGSNHGMATVSADGTITQGAAATLPSAQVYSLDAEPDGRVWIGTRGNGLAVMQAGKPEARPELAALAGHVVTAVQPDNQGGYWIATLQGLFDLRDGQLRALGPHDGSPAAKVRTILPVADGEAYIGTEAGIFHVRGKQFSRLPGTTALDASFITRMSWIGPGLLAIATMDRGLGLWRDGHLRLLSPRDGLPSANGWTLDVIGHYLYVASIDGVYRLAVRDLPDPAAAAKPLSLRSQIVIEGSQRGAGNRHYGCCNGGGDGRSLREGAILWLASSAGAVRLDTTALPPPAAPPPATVETVHNGEATYPGSGPIRLAGDSRDLQIRYTGMSLVDSRRLEFRYQLEGYDDAWVSAGQRRVAYYTHLPPGHFTFHVQARPPFGDWGNDLAPLSIDIAPRWYERSDLRLLALGLLVALVASGVARHSVNLRRRARDLQKAVDARTLELRNANAQLDEISRTDSLTGLANRRAMDTTAAEGPRNWTGAVLLIDLDRFKHINDEHGHARGDEVLVALGAILRAHTRGDDHVLRWGGEEFLIVSHRLGIDTALLLAERIRDALATQRFRGHDEAPLRVTCSVGIAELPVHPRRVGDLEAAIALADYALYRAKHEGRDRACAALLPDDGAIPEVGDLRDAIERLDALGRLLWRRSAAATST